MKYHEMKKIFLWGKMRSILLFIGTIICHDIIGVKCRKKKNKVKQPLNEWVLQSPGELKIKFLLKSPSLQTH